MMPWLSAAGQPRPDRVWENSAGRSVRPWRRSPAGSCHLSRSYAPETVKVWLFMGSRLFWSAPAERRGYIEPQRRGSQQPMPEIRVSGSTRAAATALSLGRNAFVWNGASPNPKRRRAGAPWPTRWLPSGTVDSSRCRGEVAAALQSFRWIAPVRYEPEARSVGTAHPTVRPGVENRTVIIIQDRLASIGVHLRTFCVRSGHCPALFGAALEGVYWPRKARKTRKNPQLSPRCRRELFAFVRVFRGFCT